MSRIYTNGWENGHLGEWEITSVAKTEVEIIDNDWLAAKNQYMLPIENGKYAITISGGRYIEYDLSRLPSYPVGGMRNIYARFKMQSSIPSYNSTYFSLYNGASYILHLGYNPISMYSYKTLVTDLFIEPYKWYTVEMYVEISTTRSIEDGSIHIKVNGVDILNETNVSTTNIIAADQWATILRLSGPPGAGTNYITLYDDIVICDSTTSLTDASIIRGIPSAVGANNNWDPDPSTKETYECVDDVGAQATVETDYIIALGTGGKETFPITIDSTAAVTNVESISVRTRSRRAGATSAYKIIPILRSGGVDYEKVSQNLSDDFEEYLGIWEQNPNTSLDWSASDLNNIEVGVKSDE